ncbi:hypothetical protein MAR_007401 [Mya arenaria]|uniref:Uncharacterized protein n=1 Tax=Mya arenaria TaxID=6604 RepID=A0ABY7DF07_MYAAR|nr:hypothetical protein MAR_007401 [Mya arenaria]
MSIILLNSYQKLLTIELVLVFPQI